MTIDQFLQHLSEEVARASKKWEIFHTGEIVMHVDDPMNDPEGRFPYHNPFTFLAATLKGEIFDRWSRSMEAAEALGLTHADKLLLFRAIHKARPHGTDEEASQETCEELRRKILSIVGLPPEP